MSAENGKDDWHYLAGIEVRGPVTIEQLSGLVAAGTLPDATLVASKNSGQWRPVSEVFREQRQAKAAQSGLPPLPQSKDTPQPGRSILGQIGDTINQVTETEKLEGFSAREMFSDILKGRTAAEMENYLIVGTAQTTPKMSEVETGWPKPWLFMRCLMFFFVLYAGFVAAFDHFRNPNLIPGLIIIGTSAMPLATLVLFFELNTPKNVSAYRLIVLVGLGGIASLAISLFGFDITKLDWLGASGAGIVEELGKLAALVLIVRGKRYKYILNGMLFGAAVGAGFALFESAGYAYRAGILYGAREMLGIIWTRALLAPFMHVAWTAMVGAALWRVKGAEPITIDTFGNPKFYRILLFAMMLHMLWNCPWNPPLMLKYIVLGAAAWFVIGGLVQQGLRQVRDEQRAALAAIEPVPSQIIQLPGGSSR
jgi:RsiW-degrading membrane proteinase PrsW (M82 family)